MEILRRRFLSLFFILVLVHCSAPAPHKDFPEYPALIQCYENASTDPDYKAVDLKSCQPLIHSLIYHRKLTTLKSPDLLALFTIVEEILRQDPNNSANHLETLFLMLPENKRTQTQAQQIITQWHKARQFQLADAFIQRYPKYSLTATPWMRVKSKKKSDRPRILEFNPQDKSFLLKELPLEQTDKVLVVFDFNSPISLQAHQNILQDPTFMNEFAKKSIYLAPQNLINTQQWLNWSVENPKFVHYPVFREKDFASLIADWSVTPQFHFLKKGKPVFYVVGWDRDQESLQLLKEGLQLLKENSHNPSNSISSKAPPRPTPITHESSYFEILAHAQKMKTLERTITSLPSDYFKTDNYAFVFDSSSPQKSSADFPRVLLFSKNKLLRMGFNHRLSPEKTLDIIFKNSEESPWEMREITFKKDQVSVSGKNPGTCLQCHGTKPQPLFHRQLGKGLLPIKSPVQTAPFWQKRHLDPIYSLFEIQN